MRVNLKVTGHIEGRKFQTRMIATLLLLLLATLTQEREQEEMENGCWGKERSLTEFKVAGTGGVDGALCLLTRSTHQRETMDFTLGQCNKCLVPTQKPQDIGMKIHLEKNYVQKYSAIRVL